MRASSSARQHGRDFVAPGLAAALGLLPSILAVEQGGYGATAWMAAAVLLALVVLALVWGRALSYLGPVGPLGRAPLAGLALLGLFVLWNFLSTSWAVDKAAAFEEATRTLVYGLLLLLSLALTRSARARRAFLVAFVLGVAGIGYYTVAKMAIMPHPEDLWAGLKLRYPIGYPNGQGAFFAIAVLPAFYLATRRRAAVWLRSLVFGAAVLLLLMAQLSQSRAAFWSLVVAAIVYLAVTPRRFQAVIWGALLLAFALAGFRPIDAVHLQLAHRPVDASGFHAAMVGAEAALILCPLLGALVFSGLSILERRLTVPRRVATAMRVATVVLGVILVVLAVARIPVLSHPVTAAERFWQQFSEDQSAPVSSDQPYFLDFNGNGRYPLWRVGWRVAGAHPILGVGADNFVIEWDRLRPEPFDSRYPHSLGLRLLSELGVPGLALLALGIALILVPGLLRSWGGPEQAFFAAVLATCVYYLVHDSVEWLWEIPAVAATFLLMLGLAVGVGSTSQAAGLSRAHGGGLRGVGLPAALAAVAIAVLVVTPPQYLSHRLVSQARSLNAAGDYRQARSAALWAARLDPFSAEPLVEEAEAWAAEGNATASDGAYRAAVRRNPSDQQAYLSWATTLRARGADPAPALARVRALNPMFQALEQASDSAAP